MAIEIVYFPIKNGDFPVRYVSHYQRVYPLSSALPNENVWQPENVNDDRWMFSRESPIIMIIQSGQVVQSISASSAEIAAAFPATNPFLEFHGVV